MGQFENFELSIEFKLTAVGNSGILYRVVERDGEAIWYNAPEYQVLDDSAHLAMGTLDMHKHLTGDNYDIHASSVQASNPIGEWNHARIIVNGQQAFGKAVLDALIERGEDVIAVYCPADKDGRVDPLTQAAREHDLPVYSPKSFKTDEAVEELKALNPDLGIMAFVTKFCPSNFLDVPTHGTIQYHPSLLPLHRGPSSITWPLIMVLETISN